MKYHDGTNTSIMLIMVVIIISGVIYTVCNDFGSYTNYGILKYLGRICSDLIPLASIVFGYCLGKDNHNH